jgi:hypothetical protein
LESTARDDRPPTPRRHPILFEFAVRRYRGHSTPPSRFCPKDQHFQCLCKMHELMLAQSVMQLQLRMRRFLPKPA